ncbi:hypothetical protein GGTG_01416 [Gaeumannomyces tritici R3-111a-1]|uniref:Uncharacterized protein n=1 Tax=Gaeumannomyces tritici (strain R3-111a-1) TaxID=644352 RepID=J3NJI4_GAET3|nr:hypothetical protein GGTG_01416 [Gaeumannomyces tritici R3-111a-1]EJT81436.1 hypothetical protein GGTG_01416 [Gaeumannomyces tritici R3-111a-1]
MPLHQANIKFTLAHPAKMVFNKALSKHLALLSYRISKYVVETVRLRSKSGLPWVGRCRRTLARLMCAEKDGCKGWGLSSDQMGSSVEERH